MVENKTYKEEHSSQEAVVLSPYVTELLGEGLEHLTRNPMAVIKTGISALKRNPACAPESNLACLTECIETSIHDIEQDSHALKGGASVVPFSGGFDLQFHNSQHNVVVRPGLADIDSPTMGKLGRALIHRYGNAFTSLVSGSSLLRETELHEEAASLYRTIRPIFYADHLTIQKTEIGEIIFTMTDKLGEQTSLTTQPQQSPNQQTNAA